MAANESTTARAEAEAQARATLQAIAPRLSEAPHMLLGVPADAAAPVLRAAFLRLTKLYHPTKFARFAPDVVRLANEVFLTVKRAYDQLNAGASRQAVAAGTGSLPSVRAAGTSPPARAGTIPGPGTPPPRVAPPTSTGPNRVKALTPPSGVPRMPTQGPAVPAPAPPPARHSDGIPKISYAPPPTAAARARTGSSGPVPASTAPPSNAELEAAQDLLRRKLWTDARQAFHKLAVSQPQDRKFRSYMHYARGREAEDAGKPEEARAEWQRALNLDPDLLVAKRALDDLPTDPPTGGGLFKRLFKK